MVRIRGCLPVILVISILFATALCILLAVGCFLFAFFVIAGPIVKLLEMKYPSLRPYQLPPLYLNFHKVESIFLGERTPRASVRPTLSKLKESGFYVVEPVQTERFPATPVPVVQALDPPMMSLERRLLVQYLRRLHPESVRADEDLVRSFLASVKEPKRLRYL